MNTLKVICLTLVELVKQVWRLPETIAVGLKDKRQRKVFDEQEAERLDRIRNPLKYLGRD
jgi:hypothetical protein